MLEKLQAIAREIEIKLQASLSNHNSLLGYAAAINDAIKMASSVAETVLPDSEASKTLEVVEGVIESVENLQNTNN